MYILLHPAFNSLHEGHLDPLMVVADVIYNSIAICQLEYCREPKLITVLAFVRVTSSILLFDLIVFLGFTILFSAM
jgi:hypothetical protein